MKQKSQTRLTKLLLKFLAAPVLFGAIVASTVYGVSITNPTTSLTNQNKVVTHADAVANTDQPTIDDVVNGDVSSLSEPITTANGNYILPTLTTDQTPGLLKANSFVTQLYGINFSNYKGYHVRQVIQNYNDQNQYFVLLVNDNASLSINFATDNKKLTFSTITNPGHVLAVQDTGSVFSVTADYELGAPILDNSLMSYYMGMRFQQPLGPSQTQAWANNYNEPWRNLSPHYLGITLTPRSGQLASLSVNSNSSLKKLNESWNNYSRPNSTSNTFETYAKNIATLMYLNSLNNMVFVSNKTNNAQTNNATQADALYIFGGNQYINLWFYTFNVNDPQQNPDATTPISERATSYANYRIWYDNELNKDNTDKVVSGIYSSDIETQKAYNFNYKTTDRNFNDSSSWNQTPYKEASFFGYYVAGAKFVNKPSPQIELALSIPNFALGNKDELIVFSTNVSYFNGNKYTQPPQSVILNIFGSISTDTAIQTTRYRNEQVKTYESSQSWSSNANWIPRYDNANYNFVNVISRESGIIGYAVTPEYNDGYRSVAFNKLVAYYPVTFGNDNVILKYLRDQITATVLSQTGQPSYVANLNLSRSNTSMRNLTNISYNNGVWFFTYKSNNNSQPVIYSFSYDGMTGTASFTQTNLQLENGSEVLNVIPLNSEFVYILGKDETNHKVTPLLYRLRNNTPGNYEENFAYNNLIANNQVNQTTGVPTYAGADGVQSADQKALWGTVSFKDVNYLNNAGFLADQPSVLADNTPAFNTLVDYQPGWNGQDVRVTANADNDQGQLRIQVSIKYLNGLYYTPEELSAQNSLTQVYGGFNAKPSWVYPVAISVPIVSLAILLALGLGLGIPMAKTRKLQDKGFATTFKKVDTLTSAVGSVYKKIITQTAAVKKKPQMLKSAGTKKAPPAPAAKKPTKGPSPTKPVAGSPVKKPAGAPSPTKPVASVAKPDSPVKPPIGSPKRPIPPPAAAPKA